MYPEFALIYIALAIIIVLLVIAVVLLAILLKKGNQIDSGYMPQNNRNMDNTGVNGGVVFCKRCATEYSINTKKCPNCGTPR